MFELKTSQTPMSVILETNHWPLHVANAWVFLLDRNTIHLDRELFQVKVEGYALQHHVGPLLDEFHVAVECTSLLGPPKWKNHHPIHPTSHPTHHPTEWTQVSVQMVAIQLEKVEMPLVCVRASQDWPWSLQECVEFESWVKEVEAQSVKA